MYDDHKKDSNSRKLVHLETRVKVFVETFTRVI